MKNNILIIDSDYEEATPFINGLNEATHQQWDVILEQNNKKYGIKRYMKFFWVAFKMIIKRNSYTNKTVLCWQQFYGIAIAFFLRIFHLKKKFTLVIMTFIYKPKRGIVGKLYYWFIKFVVTSVYVDKILVTSKGEVELYSKLFQCDSRLFAFYYTGAIEYEPKLYDDCELKKNEYFFSTGRSNRDYDFLINAFEKTRYKLVIACDKLTTKNTENVQILSDVFGDEMLRYMRNSKAVLISLQDNKIASGQLVLLHAMNMGIPVIVTKSKGITSDYIIDGINGIVIEKNKEDLIKAIDTINNKNLYEKLSSNSIKIFKERYTYFASGKMVGNIINSLSRV